MRFLITAVRKTPKIFTNPWVQRGLGGSVGALTLYSMGIDAVDEGMENAREKMGSSYVDAFVRGQSSTIESNLLADTKNFVRDKFIDSSLYPAWEKTKGVTLALVNHTMKNAVNLTAAVGAFSPWLVRKRPRTTGIVAAVSAGVLVLNNAKTVVREIFGLGKKGL